MQDENSFRDQERTESGFMWAGIHVGYEKQWGLKQADSLGRRNAELRKPSSLSDAEPSNRSRAVYG